MSIQIGCRIKEQLELYNQHKIHVKYKNKDYIYRFNHIWDGVHPSYNIWKNTTIDCNNNKHYFVFYGYTGSGKTYTSTQLLEQLFMEHTNENIYISAIQMYDNKIYDLYTNKPLRYYKTEQLIIKNMTTKQVKE